MCDSPVAPREKATDPYVKLTGRLELLLQLERKADLHVSTQEGLIPLWKLRRNSKIHVSTGEKSYVPASTVKEAIGPCTNCREIPRGPLQLAWRFDFPEEK